MKPEIDIEEARKWGEEWKARKRLRNRRRRGVIDLPSGRVIKIKK